MNNDILDRLQELANKWQWAQPEVRDVCRDAIYEIRLLRQLSQKTDTADVLHNEWNRGHGWGKGKDE